MSPKKQTKYYHISNVARMYDIHPQTLRLYEREGLLTPSRSDGNTRLYSEEDLQQLEVILSLTRDLGVNLAGVEVVLNMRVRIEEIEKEVNEFLEYIRNEFFEGKDDEFEARKEALVRMRSAKIIKIEIKSG
ncbi:helix-turn-helix transcriptional regulator [Acidobacteriota bacterium]